MSRNLDRRIELMFPILEKEAFKEVKMILDTYFEDNTNAQLLQPNGSWIPVEKDKNSFQAQAELYKIYKKRAEKIAKQEQTEFIVRRK